MAEIFETLFNINISDISWTFIIAQIIGLITTVTAVISAQCKSMSLILFFELLANLLVASSFILLGGNSGAYVCFAACFQTAISYIYTRKKLEVPKWITVIFLIIYIAISVITYKSLLDIIPAVCAVTFALAVVQSKSSGYRIYMCLNSLLWVIYDICVLAFTNVITHGMLLISIIIAMIRYDIKKQDNHNSDELTK